MARFALVYHTLEGQTGSIAEQIAERLRGGGHDVHLATVEGAPDDLEGFDAVVIGGSVHTGHHHRDLVRYATAHAGELNGMASAFFSVSLTATDPDAEHQATAHKMVDDFIEKTGWHPDVLAVFGGAVKYREYGFIKRRMMKMIVGRQGGPTDTSRDHEFTDWDAVHAFAADLAEHLVSSEEPSEISSR